MDDEQRVEERTKLTEVVVVPETQALAPQQRAEAPSLEGLAWMEDPQKVIDRMRATAESLRKAAIAMTYPQDWIANVPKDGSPMYSLLAQGAQRVMPLLGLKLTNLQGENTLEPESIVVNGRNAFKLQWLASSRTLNIENLYFEVTRGAGEKFAGRGVDDDGYVTTKVDDIVDAYLPDLSSATRTAAMTKTVVQLLGLKNLPGSELEAVWKNLNRSLADVKGGMGSGSSAARAAKRVQEPEVAAEAQKIWVDIQRRTKGDPKESADLLYDITVSKSGASAGKFGIRTPEEFTKVDQIEPWAWKRLRAHPVYGDEAIKKGAEG